MTEKIAFLWPEIILFIATCIVMLLGLSPKADVRRSCALIAGVALLLAGLVGSMTPMAEGSLLLPGLMGYAKGLISIVGLLLLLLAVGTVDRADEELIRAGRRVFDPMRANTGEFYAFFLFSLTGLMLCTSADDLIWLFLALELTSLPTYVMVTLSTRGTRSQEAGVKYFFLGALGAAIFLYGFALLYGGSGTTNLTEMHAYFTTHGLNPIATAGLVLSLVGVSFKIAAVPMHFYTADVYQGAASSVSAFLAFVPKTAGFIAILLLASAVGWQYGGGFDLAGATPGTGDGLPGEVRAVLWVIAALTMTIGNVLALQQSSVKRMLAYSSIAHSGYMLVGVIAGPGDGSFAENGIAAVMFYLLTYGVMNVGAFAVVASLERTRRAIGTEAAEAETVDELKGLCRTRPLLGWTMVICALGLLGLPPLLGFWGKVPLFTSAISSGEIVLVVILGLNSAIAAFYYLRLVNAAMLSEPDSGAAQPIEAPFFSRQWAGAFSAGGVPLLAAVSAGMMSGAEEAATYRPMSPEAAQAYLIERGRVEHADGEHIDADHSGHDQSGHDQSGQEQDGHGAGASRAGE